MKISIIIPIYKVEKQLRRCLDSVINQTYKNIEIILVDDGSPDKCGEICDEYAKKDNRVKVIHKANEGVSEARNTGMRIASGQYLFFIDSDDFIEENTVYLLYKRAIETDSDIVIGNFQFINEKQEITYRKPFEKEYLDKKMMKSSNEKFKYFFGKSYGINVWNKLYKLDFLNEANIYFDKTIDYGEDF
ncbi:MAG: glycosyltransferase family 2 protein, partial [Eubacteriales bacterium]